LAPNPGIPNVVHWSVVLPGSQILKALPAVWLVNLPPAGFLIRAFGLCLWFNFLKLRQIMTGENLF
jgi:hypothetical protein